MEKNNMGPIHKTIKEDIVDAILSGIYAPGDLIPTQSEYAKKYNVSRLTVRKAIDELVLKGILQTEKGKGTFVQEIATNTYSYRRLSGLSSNIVSQKARLRSQVIDIREIAADKLLAKKLQIEEKSLVVVIERLRFVNDIGVSYQKSYLARSRVSDIDFIKENLNENSLYELLRAKLKITLSYVDEQFRAIRALGDIARHLAIEEGDPVLYVNRTTYDSFDVPIEYCKNYESSDVNGVWVKSISIE